MAAIIQPSISRQCAGCIESNSQIRSSVFSGRVSTASITPQPSVYMPQIGVHARIMVSGLGRTAYTLKIVDRS